jgi:hypothetical protein
MDKEIASCKGEIGALLSKEKGLAREIDGISNELNSTKGQLNGEKSKNEALFRDLTDLKAQLNQLHQREQQAREAYDKVKNEFGVFQQMNQDNFRNLQRDYDNLKNSNMELKAQLDQANMQAKIQATYAQQVQYQPPPVQYRPPPPQYEAYPQYPQPQFNYAPPVQHEPEPRYQSHYSPPHEEFIPAPVSRNQYSEGPTHSQSLVSCSFHVYYRILMHTTNQ